MIQVQLIACRVNNDPPGYRVVFDGVEIGWISKQTRHIHLVETNWRWGVDAMPLMSHAGRRPSGEAESFDGPLRDFKSAFTHWLASRARGVAREPRAQAGRR